MLSLRVCAVVTIDTANLRLVGVEHIFIHLLLLFLSLVFFLIKCNYNLVVDLNHLGVALINLIGLFNVMKSLLVLLNHEIGVCSAIKGFEVVRLTFKNLRNTRDSLNMVTSISVTLSNVQHQHKSDISSFSDFLLAGELEHLKRENF